MNINELIEQIGGRERLEKIASWSDVYGRDANVMLPASEAEAMANALLAVLDAQVNSTIRKRKALLWLERQQVAHPGMNEVRYAIELITTPPAASAPDGWKLMPLKASPEILQAGIKAHYERQKYQQPEDVEFKGPMECAYDDMLSAAPAPGGDDVKQG